jgi:hypothetical protein
MMPSRSSTDTVAVTTGDQTMQDGAMSDTTNPGNGPQLRSAPLITGAAIGGAGVLLALAGLAVSASHIVAATRRWIRAMEVPPSELAKLKWTQAKAAAAAGADAWQNTSPAQPGQHS